jgi:gamma-glutamylcyclotransferase (GGCT)/AIG2-like uncharacterized protein YtfP
MRGGKTKMANSGHYFAYGSNLNVDDLERRGVHPEGLSAISPAWLPDHELVFGYRSMTRRGGVLDILPRVGHLVPGVVFELASSEWPALDKKEGAPRYYERVRRTALLPNGDELPVQTYRVQHERRQNFVEPTAEYLKIIRSGREKFGLPTDDLEYLARGESPAPLDGVFAYGTLMRGEELFERLAIEGLTCTLLAETPGRLLDLGSYPGMLLAGSDAPHSTWVQGELFRHSQINRLLPWLDEMEDCYGFGNSDSLYRRTVVDVGMCDGRVRRAWTYVFNRDPEDYPVIASGSWRQHQGIERSFIESLVRAHCSGNDEAVARALVSLWPFAAESDTDAVARNLLPLADALLRRDISERRLAQITDRWVAVPETPPNEA